MAKTIFITTGTILVTIAPGTFGDKLKGIPPTKPKTQTIPAGTPIELDTDSQEYRDLESARTIRLPEEGELDARQNGAARVAVDRTTPLAPLIDPELARQEAERRIAEELRKENEGGAGNEGGDGSTEKPQPTGKQTKAPAAAATSTKGSRKAKPADGAPETPETPETPAGDQQQQGSVTDLI